MIARFVTASAAIVLLVTAPPPAQAQMFNQIGGKAPPPAPAIAPPPALPGAASPRDAAPAVHSSADMEPNDALFDSINRGDIAAARDAISRGADLRARNVLGMTPIELSVDLGRNDISFMLLSMRGGEDGPPRAATATADRSAKPPPKQQVRQVSARPAPGAAPRVAATAPTPARSQTARLYGGDGGAPNPDAGFLGFDASRR
jgi:hypothetical protein